MLDARRTKQRETFERIASRREACARGAATDDDARGEAKDDR